MGGIIHVLTLTGIDPVAHVYETWKELVVLENVDHIQRYTGRERHKVGAIVHFKGGGHIYVVEDSDKIHQLIQVALHEP